MKKLITLCIALFVSAVMFAQNLPAFTESENAYVFDAKTLKEDFGDACKIVNLTFEKNLKFDVYLMKSTSRGHVVTRRSAAVNSPKTLTTN